MKKKVCIFTTHYGIKFQTSKYTAEAYYILIWPTEFWSYTDRDRKEQVNTCNFFKSYLFLFRRTKKKNFLTPSVSKIDLRCYGKTLYFKDMDSMTIMPTIR